MKILYCRILKLFAVLVQDNGKPDLDYLVGFLFSCSVFHFSNSILPLSLSKYCCIAGSKALAKESIIQSG